MHLLYGKCMANYLVATLPDRVQAETAYITLEEADLPPSQLSIYGRGFTSAEECESFDPTLMIRRNIKRMLMWVLPFGFFGGFTFNQLTQLTILSEVHTLADAIIGGFLGAIAGAMGAFASNGGIKLLRGPDTVPFSQRLQSGQYLLVVKGSEALVRQANRALRPLHLEEALQIFEGPD